MPGVPVRDGVSWLFLVASVWGAIFTYNGFRPVESPSRRAAISFFAGWLTTELALHHLAWQALATAVFVWLGALDAWPGRVGLVITLVSWAGLIRLITSARSAEAVVEDALVATLGPEYRSTIPPAIVEKFAPRVDWHD